LVAYARGLNVKKSTLIVIFFFLLNYYANAFEQVVIILGPPGAGKGTQSQMLGKKLDWPVLGASNILRAEALLESKLGELYYNYISHDPETRAVFRTGVMMQNIARNNEKDGLILEGWPNSSASLNTFLMTKVPKQNILVIELVVPDEVLLARISQRKQCLKCGASYGLGKREEIENICNNCQEDLQIRLHDNEKEFKERLIRFKIKQKRYHDAYFEHGIRIISIDAEASPQEVNYGILNR